ncbi:MAG: hypothetical protein IPN85_01510 [Flavobacteriales bacterium]|nr:hypothetical protein [Flavobacteriales bacterium]MBK9286133.1 hypothetical protein [Flavobacteriales bacterium]MBL0034508.1 hypothetical protein [Flavobacteriales bacterium]
MTALSLAIHFAPPLNSTLSMSNEDWNTGGDLVSSDYIAHMLEFHRSGDTAFIRRPLTTWCMDGVAAIGVPSPLAFMLCGFVLFMVAGVLVYRAARSIGADQRQATTAQVLFHLAPTVLFAYFAPIYSYDEPLQYVLLLIALASFAAGRSWAFILAFALALVARESSLLLLPSIAYLALSGERTFSLTKARWRTLLVLGAPVVLYAAFLALYLDHVGMDHGAEAEMGSRMSLFDENFKNGDTAGESLSFLFLALGLPLFLIGRYVLGPACPASHKQQVRAMLIALLVNTAVVLVATKAREARLFALPLVLVFPLLGHAWQAEMARHQGFFGLFRFLRRWDLAMFFLFAGSLVVLVSDHLFVLSDGVASENLFHEVFMVQALFMLCCWLSDITQRGHHGNVSS